MENSRLYFRAWHKEAKGFYYFNIFDLRKHSLDEFDDDNVEQCTGLKDKNGNLIYEGDIVNESFLGKTVVKWLDDKCGYNISKSFEYDDGRCKFESESWYEIIGNIHENPELLEDK